MKGWMAAATFGVLVVASAAWGQMRGGFAGARAGAGMRAPIVARGPMMANHPLGVSVGRTSFGRGGFHPPFVGPGFRGFPGRRGFFHGYWYPYGYYGGYPLFWDSSDSSANAYDQQTEQLQQQIGQLSDEVERLRAEQAERSVAPPPAPPQQAPAAAPTAAVPTTLVFRDGKTQQVQNYAIAGHTLWVFNQQRTMKIPLSELDVSATQKANEERGISFHVPPAA